jgi:hypothetical protein
MAIAAHKTFLTPVSVRAWAARSLKARCTLAIG